MAETLGSLIDKLTIKKFREHYLRETLKPSNRVGFRQGRGKIKNFPFPDLKKKLKLVQSQEKDLIKEINSFIIAAVKGKVKISYEKLKIYNVHKDIGRIPKLNSLGQTISCLAQKNLELWCLEDEARRRDVGYAYIGKIKRKIDRANQQRNDLIDALDELLERCLRENTSSS